MIRPLLTALAVAATALALAACGSGGDKTSAATTPASTAAATTATGASGCRQVAAPQPEQAHESKPPARLPSGKSYTIVVDTNCGSFTIALDTAGNPKTAASLGTLARRGFFDGLGFHRIAPGFVIQGGDPAGDGSGGPGYSIVEAPSKKAGYTRGVVAMAKTGDDPPGTSGSQFFVVTAPDAGLPPDYAIAGRVTAGMDTVDRIAAVGVKDCGTAQGCDGPPAQPVVIAKATLRAQ